MLVSGSPKRNEPDAGRPSGVGLLAPVASIRELRCAFDSIFTDSAYHDAATDLWDFPAREYHPTQGRWISPDPAGPAGVTLTDPQTWNPYAYVRNTPTSYVYPDGLVSYCPYGADNNTHQCLPPPATIPPPPNLCAWLGICQYFSPGGTSGGDGATPIAQQQQACIPTSTWTSPALPNVFQGLVAITRVAARLSGLTIGLGIGGGAGIRLGPGFARWPNLGLGPDRHEQQRQFVLGPWIYTAACRSEKQPASARVRRASKRRIAARSQLPKS
jgi:RHS repeat-associated protein